MECAICFEVISNSCSANCGHHFCYKCLMKWCYKGGKTCPLCKRRMFQIILDKEFDLKNNPKNKEKIKKKKTKKIVVNLENEIEAGIEISKRTNDKSLGVIVTRLERTSKLINYLKLYDKIVYINGLPCINIYDTMEIIKHISKNGSALTIEVELKDNYLEDKLLRCFNCMNIGVVRVI